MTALSDSVARAQPLPAASAPPARKPPLPSPPPANSSLTIWLLVVLVVVLFSGGLFGYDQGVISGALPASIDFRAEPLHCRGCDSCNLAALLGALAGGEIADRIGRKRTVLIAGALFTLGAAVQAFAPETMVLVADASSSAQASGCCGGRAALCGRTRPGVMARALRLRLSARHHHRHLPRLSGDGWLSADANWRMMLGASAMLGLLLFVVALWARESPRWLIECIAATTRRSK